ncbi:tetratricopeptide repeat protein [Aliterella atlantica]|uniref:Uncharacterized protein n=1 Tax=Aliterella atlantica CENA595 TaxID=1618023 RepID=A0A0D8ZMN7_9CYAN|nr:tetratricopeptide repeat protein [Aliterella atlantica]KJH70108.1 hypothetical protein UH38_19760 [Aliterella atlantica CENA595]
MLETSGQTSLIAAAVVLVGLITLGFFVREGIVTSSLYNQAVKLYQEKDYQSAEATLQNVLSRHPSNDIARLLLGESLMQLGKLDDATSQFNHLISRSPKNADAHLRLGTALMKQEKLEGAIAAFTTAKDLFLKQKNPQKAEQIEQLLQQLNNNRV